MSLKLGGCAAIKFEQFYPYKYGIGTSVYVCAKARRGKIERVTIKRVYLHKVWNQPKFMFLDTTNEIWEEKELCTHAEAVTFARRFLERELMRVEEASQTNCSGLYNLGDNDR